MLPWWWYLPYSNRILFQIRGVAKFKTLKLKIALKTRLSLERAHCTLQTKSRKFWKFENLIRQILFIFFRDPVKKFSASWDQFEKISIHHPFFRRYEEADHFFGFKKLLSWGLPAPIFEFRHHLFFDYFSKIFIFKFFGSKIFFWGPRRPKEQPRVGYLKLKKKLFFKKSLFFTLFGHKYYYKYSKHIKNNIR